MEFIQSPVGSHKVRPKVQVPKVEVADEIDGIFCFTSCDALRSNRSNGRSPSWVIEGARRAGVTLSVAAIREETDPGIEQEVERLMWVGIGQLGKMIRFFKGEGVEKAIMAGQVKHVQIFSRAVPDARMLKMLLKLPRRNTNSLIGALPRARQ